MDVFEKCSQFQFASELEASNDWPYFVPFDESEGTEVSSRGRRLVMAGSNNYLGLSTDRRVRQAAITALERFGTSCTGSRLHNGTLTLHQELEAELAAYVGKAASLVFSTGYQVNLGVISALVGEGDTVLIDREDHASIYDGCRLARGAVRRFRHSDIDQLRRQLQVRGAKLVVIDGVYSISGEIALLPDIARMCREYGARLMVDDAHAIGVLGGGRGTAAHFGLTDNVDLIMGTFSKSLASVGGFIAGDAEVIQYLRYSARSMIFSASISPANAAAALTALRILRDEPERVSRLNTVSERMRRTLRGMGLDIGQTQTPIVPIKLSDEAETLAMWRMMFEAGVYVNCIVPPAVSPDACCLRSSYMATHSDEQLARITEAFRTVGESRTRACAPSVSRPLNGTPYGQGAGYLMAGAERATTAPTADAQLIKRLVVSVAEVEDYTCIFTKQERVDGNLLPTETLLLKQSRRLNALYLKWIGEPFKGRELIYAPDRYGPKMKVRDGGGLRSRLGTISLDPHDRLARRGNRHLVTEMGLFHVVEAIVTTLNRDGDRVRYSDPHEDTIAGEPSIVMTRVDPANTARARIDLAVHRALGLPTMIRIADTKGDLIECHMFRSYRINPGLGTHDFDLANPEYGFGLAQSGKMSEARIPLRSAS